MKIHKRLVIFKKIFKLYNLIYCGIFRAIAAAAAAQKRKQFNIRAAEKRVILQFAAAAIALKTPQ